MFLLISVNSHDFPFKVLPKITVLLFCKFSQHTKHTQHTKETKKYLFVTCEILHDKIPNSLSEVHFEMRNIVPRNGGMMFFKEIIPYFCLLYTSDAADE